MTLALPAMIVGQGSAPDLPGARILLEARDSVTDRAGNIATCNTTECQVNDIEGSIASESFCDTLPIRVAGAEGSCPAPATVAGEPPPDLGNAEAYGCLRFADDRANSETWHMDDNQKLCVLRSCAGGLPCFAGHAKSDDPTSLWSQGASLELPAAAPVQIEAGADFHLWTVVRAVPTDDRACLAGSALHHLCVEPDRSFFLRLYDDSTTLTAPGALPLGAWTSIELQRENGALRLFVDGVDHTLGNPTNTTDALVVGYFMSAFKGDKAFPGQVAGLWLYERVLSAAERTSMHQFLADDYGAGPSSPLGRLRLDARPDKYVFQRFADGAGAGEWGADPQISGTYEGLSPAIEIPAVEARAVDADTLEPVTAWSVVDPAPADGTWSGTLGDVPQGGWYRVEARFVDTPTIGVLAAERFGVGLVIAAIGQSNMVKFFTEDEADGSLPAPFATPHALTHRYGYGEPTGFEYSRPHTAAVPVSWGPVTGTGAIRLANNLVAELGVPVLLLDFSLDWTGLVQHWTNFAGFVGWSRFADALAQVSGLEAVLWHQGAYDAHVTIPEYAAEGDEYTSATYTAGLDSLYAAIVQARPETAGPGPLPMLVAVQNRGVYDDLLIKDDAYDLVRRAQVEWIDTRPHGFALGNTVDLDISSRVGTGSGHFRAADYQEMADRATRGLLHALGRPGWVGGAGGGRLLDATLSGQNIRVRVTHDRGERLRLDDPLAAIEGFLVTDGEWVVDVNGVPTRQSLAIASATLSDDQPGNWVELVLAEPPTGPVRLRYCDGQNPFRDQSTDAERRQSGNVLLDDFAYHPERTGLPILPTTGDLWTTPVGALVVDATSLVLGEGSSVDFQVGLDTAPTQTVLVQVEIVGDPDLGLVGTYPLAFEPAQGLATQTVTVEAAVDADTLSGTAAVRLTADGWLPTVVRLAEQDSDPNLVIDTGEGTGGNGDLAVSGLGGTDTFTVALGAPPASPVRLLLGSGDPTRLGIEPPELDFDANSWSTPRTVTVTGLDSGVVSNESASPVEVVISIDDATSDDLYDPLPDERLDVRILDLAAGLVLHWPLDQVDPPAAGQTRSTTPDASPWGRHGEVGSRVRTQLVGVEGGALGSSGPGQNVGDVDDTITAPAFDATAAGDELTVLLWYRLDAGKHDGYLFHWGGSHDAPHSVSAYLDLGSALRLRVHAGDDTTSVEQIQPAGFGADGWHHLAMVKHAGGSRFYFDGELVSTSAMGAGTLLPTQGFGLGSNELGTYGALADFDDVRIYDRALVDAEVRALFEETHDSPVTLTLGPDDGATPNPAIDGRWAVLDTATLEEDGLAGGEPTWRVSGESVELPPGTHTLRFADVTGWSTPPDRSITVALGKPLDTGETYTLTGDGRLLVHVLPAALADASGPAVATWQVDGGEPQTGGEQVVLPVGFHTVTFGAVPGWLTPEPQTVEILDNQTTEVWGSWIDIDAFDPILHLRLDESSGTVVTDSSAGSHHGTLGADTIPGLPGIDGTAIASTGPGGNAGSLADGLQVPDLAPDDTYTDLTVAFWYRAEHAHDGYLFTWGGSYTDDNALSAYLDHGTELRIRVHEEGDGSSVAAIAPPGFDDGAWHHLVIVKSPAGTALYFDGVHQLNSPMGNGPISPAIGLTLGTNEIGTYGVQTRFDQFQVWARALDAAEVADLHGSATEARLELDLLPSEAVAAGARWFLVNDPATLYSSGQSLVLEPGSHQLGFTEVEGWVAPAGRTVAVVAGQTTVETAFYTTLAADDPILRWTLDELTGTVAIDSSGFGRHGTIGSQVLPEADGLLNGAWHTVGAGAGTGSLQDGIHAPDFAPDDTYLEATVSLWYRLDGNAHDGYLFYWGGTYDDPSSISVYLDLDKELRIRVHDQDDSQSSATAAPAGFAAPGWHHLVIVKSAAGTDIYFDGVFQSSHAMGAGFFAPTDGVGLGSNEVGTFGTVARFDELQLWERALDATEIAALYHVVEVGELRVDFAPTEVEGLASWRLATDDANVQHGHQETVSLAPGVYTLSFAAVPGYILPDDRTVVVALGQTTLVTVDYDALPSGPIVALDLDETEGATAFDSSGFGHHADIGSRVRLDLQGVDGRALQTAAPGGGAGTFADSLQLPLDFTAGLDELTLAFWYRLAPTPHDGYLLTWGGSFNDPDSVSVFLQVGGELRIRMHDGADSQSTISVTTEGFDDYAWHHLVLSKDLGGTRVYFDGQRVATHTVAGDGSVWPREPLRLGTNEIGRYGVEATFDQLRIWQRALGDAEVAELHGSVTPPTGFGGAYRTVDQVDADLRTLEAVHPGLLQRVPYGESWAKAQGGITTPDGDVLPGDDLVAVRLTNLDTLAPGDPDRPVMVLAACLHAREIATPEVAMRLVETLLADYGNDADTTWLLDHHEIWVLPMVNPDGHRMVELGAEPANGSRPWSWRKNVRETSASCAWPPVGGDTWGVDINRNFDIAWASLGGTGGSTDPCDSFHHGPAAASEPETQALVGLLGQLIPDQRADDLFTPAPDTATGLFIQLHSPFRTLGWPWAHTDVPAPNAEGLAAIGQKLAALNGYTAAPSHTSIYTMAGTADDWVYAELGAPAFILELGEDLMPAYHHVDNTLWPENREALLYAAKIARTPYLDALGPEVRALAADILGSQVTLTATVDDTQNGGEVIDTVELYVGEPPWSQLATAQQPFTADDGALDSANEAATAVLDTSSWTLGRHLVYVRARDVSGHWGPPSAVFVDVD